MEKLFPYEKIEAAGRFYDLMIRTYKPYVRIALVSGGDDSMTLIEVLRMVGKVDYVVHVDTTTGLEVTQEHVYNYCNENNLSLIIQRTPEESFEEIALECGFPGPPQHGTMYIRLKERALRVVQRRFQFENSFCRINSWEVPKGKRKTPLVYNSDYPDSEALVESKGNRIIMYFTGARRDESIRRMGTVQDVHKEGNQVWVNLIADFTKSDIHHIQQQNKVVRNPASVLLGRSCECNDGAYGDPTELALMNTFYPNDKSVRMLNRVQETLTKRKHTYCKYGHRGDNEWIGSEETTAPLCSSCINSLLPSNLAIDKNTIL